MNPESLPDISSYAAPLYMAFIVIEIIAILHFARRGDYEAKDSTTSLLMGTGNVVLKLALHGTIYAGILALYGVFYQIRLINIPAAWWAVVLCFVLYDLVMYWIHRFEHTIRWAWASHVVHHSSQHYNLSTALRQTWTGFATGMFLLAIPLVWLGFHPMMVVFVSSLNLVYQFFVHTETIKKFPRVIEAIMNTPSHHRVHHGKNPQYLDANYGGVFIVWDRIFGTFVSEQEPVRYGTVRDIGTFNPLRVATHEYVAIFHDVTQRGLTLGQRIGYIFAPPGWSHDGSRMTSDQLKAAAIAYRQKKPEDEGRADGALHPAE